MQILIVKTSSLGDVIQALPLLSLLRHHFPDCAIDWIVERPFAELLGAAPLIRRVIPIEVRRWKKRPFHFRHAIYAALSTLRVHSYDLLIDLQGNIKSAMLTACARAKVRIGSSFATAPEWPSALFLTRRYPRDQRRPITSQYLHLVEQHLKLKCPPSLPPLLLRIDAQEEAFIASLLKPGTRYMVCISSFWENKKLSQEDWRRWLSHLYARKELHLYWVWGTEKERREVEALLEPFATCSTLLPRLSLPVWQRLISHMDALLSVDSSALHLAATTATPTYALFGPSNASIYNPPGERHHFFQGRCPYGKRFVGRCPLLRSCSTGACLKELPENFWELFTVDRKAQSSKEKAKD